MFKKNFCSMHYFDVIAGAIGLVVAVASLFIATRQSWWNYKDSAGVGLFLFAMTTFILLRRRAYAQRVPWLLLCFSALLVPVIVILFRRWSLTWVIMAVGLLLFGLVMRSKTVSEPVSREHVLAPLLIAGSLLFTLTLIEGTLRLFPDLLPEGARLRIDERGIGKPWYIPHPYIGYLHVTDAEARAGSTRPGVKASRMDMWGFRNTWPWPERAEIVAVGDSWTFSLMVNDEQAWTTLLERALPHNRVLNLGLIGAGPQQYLRVYETFGIDLAPKVLLVGLFLANDLTGAKRFDLWSRSGGKESLLWREATQGWIVGMVRKTYLFTLLQDLGDSYQSGRFLKDKTITLASGDRLHLVPGLLARMALYDRPGDLEFTLVLETLEGIQTLAKQHRTHCLVLFFPSKEEVYLPILGEKAADLAAPFIPELDKRGIAYLDLGPYFRERAAAGETLFWEVDGHPNPHGYTLIAEVVLSHLKANASWTTE